MAWGSGQDTAWWPRFIPHPTTDEGLLQETIANLREHGVVRAIASGSFANVARYQAFAPDLIIPGIMIGPDANRDSLRARYQHGAIRVFGEVTWQYAGLSPADPVLEPYWMLAEDLDAPVGLHLGLGPPEQQRHGAYRIALSDPLQLEEVLVRHPRLRLWIMHAGWPLLDNTVAALYSFPQLYVDVSVINWYIPRVEFHAYLRRLVDAGFGDRIMYGSDQMIWPASIPIGIDAIESAGFLTESQKRAILCDNAARFFKLDPALCR
jgi:predicted TIM-barrel fold metal-dependent hydrolase